MTVGTIWSSGSLAAPGTTRTYGGSVSRSSSTAGEPGVVVDRARAPGGTRAPPGPRAAGDTARASRSSSVGAADVAPLALPAEQLVVEADLLAVIAQHGLDVVRHEVGALVHADVEDPERLRVPREACVVMRVVAEHLGRPGRGRRRTARSMLQRSPTTTARQRGRGQAAAQPPAPHRPEHAAAGERPRRGAGATPPGGRRRWPRRGPPAPRRRGPSPPTASTPVSAEQRQPAEHGRAGRRARADETSPRSQPVHAEARRRPRPGAPPGRTPCRARAPSSSSASLRTTDSRTACGRRTRPAGTGSRWRRAPGPAAAEPGPPTPSAASATTTAPRYSVWSLKKLRPQ